MRRGSTPTLVIKIDGADVSDMEHIYLTFEQGNRELTKRETDIVIDEDENTLSCPLSEAETLYFKDGDVKVQIRVVFTDGTKDASDIVTDTFEHILLEGEIE